MTELTRLSDLDDQQLRAWYAPPRTPWLRLNFVATVDGAVQGEDGLSKSINNAADKRVFDALRTRADAIIVGAGTVRDEAYRPNAETMVVVTRSGQVPPSLLEGRTDRLMIATGAAAPRLAEARDRLGEDRVLVLGETGPDLVRLRDALVERGHAELLCEGGPHLSRDLLAAGVVDELCLTTVPRLVAGERLGLAEGPAVDVPLRLAALLEQDGTLLGRWHT